MPTSLIWSRFSSDKWGYDSLPHSTIPEQPVRRSLLALTRRYLTVIVAFSLCLSGILIFSILCPSTSLVPWKDGFLSQKTSSLRALLGNYQGNDAQLDDNVTHTTSNSWPTSGPLRDYILHNDPPFPPLYSDYHQRELELPQHNPDLPFPEGRNGKYLWIGNHQRSVGWGNAMQELLLLHYLSYRSGRTFVFDNYTWNEDGSDYSDYNGKPIPSRIPLSALLHGPTVGAPYTTEAGLPRSVKKEFFDKICPEPVTIMNDDVKTSLGWEYTANMILEKWVEVLSATDEPCIQVPRHSWPIFDIFMFGNSNRMLDLWPEFSTSPILSEVGWSPLIERAFDKNRIVFAPFNRDAPYLTATPRTATPSAAERYPALPGLLVLHIRRGDFAQHCAGLATWASTYTAYNAFPGLPDAFTVPPDSTPETRLPLYLPRCYPTISQIVGRVQEVRAASAGRGLREVYIMTNGDVEWVEELKRALRVTGAWANIASSRDLVVNHEERYVKHAVDMLIGQRAQVFVGNGFSSLSGLIIMLRMANGLPPDSNRHWQ